MQSHSYNNTLIQDVGMDQTMDSAGGDAIIATGKILLACFIFSLLMRCCSSSLCLHRLFNISLAHCLLQKEAAMPNGANELALTLVEE